MSRLDKRMDNVLTPLSSGALSEPDLISQAKSGDVKAFEALIAPHLQKIYNLALYYCANEDDASDIAQETLVKAMVGIKSFQGKSSFKTWIFKITRNCFIDFTRKNKKFYLHSGQDPDSTSSKKQGPLDNLDQQEKALIVKELLRGMDPKYAEPIELVDLSELSYEESSEILGIGIGTLKSRLFRAREIFGIEAKKRKLDL